MFLYDYYLFNNQMRRLILTMGEDGVELLNILNDIEKFGAKKYTIASHLTNGKRQQEFASASHGACKAKEQVTAIAATLQRGQTRHFGSSRSLYFSTGG